jgi:uncharacterized protein
MDNTQGLAAPVAPSERVPSLDVLRGFAVLGILIMNIQAFSMIDSAYINPAAYGSLVGINKWVSILSHVFADAKFMTIFSILYGAGILMITGKIESRGGRAAGLHYRRTLWLLMFGLMHAYLLWYGDILVAYGVCALLVYLFRNARPKRLLIAGLIVFSVGFLLFLFFGLSLKFWPPEAYQDNMSFWKPGAEAIQRQITAYRGGWLDQMAFRVPASVMHQTFLFLIRTGWRAFGLMLVGMALFKWGVLTGRRSRRFYVTLMCVGWVAGFSLVAYGVLRNYAAGWSFDYSMFLGGLFNYWGSLGVSLGYISVIMLFCRSDALKKLTSPFAAVGRMAFTNYLMQSLICTTLFYGHGFGLFGRVERQGQILIVFAVWAFQLMVSPVWLRHFRFGPFEWIWRSLAYLKPQPMRPQSGDLK